MKKSKGRFLVPFIIISIFSLIIAFIYVTLPLTSRVPSVTFQSEQFKENRYSMDSDELTFNLDIENHKTEVTVVEIYLYTITPGKINEENEVFTLVDQMTVKEEKFLNEGGGQLTIDLEESTYYEIEIKYTYTRDSLFSNQYRGSINRRFKTE